MELGNTAASIALRNAVRLAWALARVARALGDLGERLELAVERQAELRQVDLTEVLEPLIADAVA